MHFLGKLKPWNYSYDAQRAEVRGHAQSPDSSQLHPDYLLMWWQLYTKSVLPILQRAYGDAPFNSGFVEMDEYVSQLCVCVCLFVVACCIFVKCVSLPWSELNKLLKCHIHTLSHPVGENKSMLDTSEQREADALPVAP